MLRGDGRGISQFDMSDEKTRGDAMPSGMRSGGRAKGDLPEWTEGLRRLYDEVVDEELPDSFRSLLARLDEGE